MAKRRPSGEGMIRRKKKGQWEGRIVVGHKENSDPIFRYVYAKTQKELIGKLHLKIDEFRDAELTEDSKMSLCEWLDKWLTEYMQGTVRKGTLSSYKNYAENYIKPALGDKSIAFITTADVQKFYNNLRKNGRIKNQHIYGNGLSDASVVRIHCMLHETMEMAVKEHLISKNPTNGTTVPKIVKKEMQVLTDEQLATFMKLVDAEEHWRDFFYTELTTGLRRGEICGLKWTDFDEVEGKLNINRSIDVRNGEIIVGETKTGQGKRSFYLPVSTANVLRERKKNSKSEWIFTDLINPKLPIAPPAAYRKMKQLLKKAGLPNIRFHDLRHTFATMALEHGMDVKTLSATIGHVSSATTLDIYSHITDTMQRQAAVHIDRKIGGTDAQMPTIAREERKDTAPVEFTPYKPKIRKPGTGCVTMINDHLYEGRYTPTNAYGKRESHNIYAKTREECEEKLAEMIAEVKAQIKAEKEKMTG